jgi:hypothetical protein
MVGGGLPLSYHICHPCLLSFVLGPFLTRYIKIKLIYMKNKKFQFHIQNILFRKMVILS